MFLLSGIFCSGLYPAYITLCRTPASLFGSISIRSRRNSLVHFLTIAQFTSAVVLVICAFAVFNQIRFVLGKDLGFKRDRIVILDLPYLLSSSFKDDLSSFLKQIQSLPDVENYAVSSTVAGDNEPIGLVFRKTDESTVIGAASDGVVDERFLSLYGIQLVAGRNFIPDHPADQNAIIISRKILKSLGVASATAAVGKKVIVLNSTSEQPAEIIGVIEDYTRMPLVAGFQSYWNDNMGVCLTYGNHLQPMQRPKKVSLQIRADNFDATLKRINSLFAYSFQGTLFNWYFLDQHINRHYKGEKIIRNQILVFTGLAIGIACLGLLGMISYRAIDKNREMGIRKVFGAQRHQLTRVLVNTAIKEVCVSIIIGVPIAYYFVQQYNQNFIDRIPIQWWHFALPLVMLMSILLGSIAVVLWRAMHANPAESLRYE